MERFEIIVTSDADQDMEEIFSHISGSLQEPSVAASLIERIYNRLLSLADMPERFALSRDRFLAKQGFRVLPIENHLVFYVVDRKAGRVVIHRVLYGKRDYMALFLAEED